MIVWRNSYLGGQPAVPPCLEGWEPRGDFQLVHRDTAEGHVVGVGDPLVWSPPRRWQSVADGWEVSIVPGAKISPSALARVQIWCDVSAVEDLQRRPWFAPSIRRKGGGRAFRVAYGRDWLPELTPDQRRAEEICAAVQDAIGQETPMTVACQWAAELLTMTHHLTTEAFAALALLDEPLVVGTLKISAALEIDGPTNGL